MDEKDLKDLVRLVRADQEVADELRRVLLTDELLHLPQIVALQGENLARLTDRVDALTERMGALTDQMGALTERVERIEAQLGTLIDTVAELARGQADLRDLLGRFVQASMAAFGRIESRLDQLARGG